MTWRRASVARSPHPGRDRGRGLRRRREAGRRAGGQGQKIAITPTADARADAKTYLAKLCPKPIGGELNFMVWEGYTDTLFAKPFEEACGVKVNATYMGSSDDLVAKLRAGGAETIDLDLSLERRGHRDHRGRAGRRRSISSGSRATTT